MAVTPDLRGGVAPHSHASAWSGAAGVLLLFTCGQTMVEVMKIMVTSFRHCYTQCLHPAAGHCRPTPPPETPEHSWASKGQSLVGSLLLSLGFWCTQGLFVPSKSLFPSNTVSLIEKLLFLFSCQVMSNSSRPHGLQHTRLPCPSISPGVYRSSFPLNW